ncbi:MAG TPA: hypothetical protein VET90_06340, partial [Candidatus Binatus sp.]|nr:hypothetical protein [Candidatus Binatus sp.]
MRRTGLLFIAVVGVFALVLDFWPNLTIPDPSGATAGRVIETRLGLDLKGDLRVEYRVDPAGGKSPS